MTARLHPLTPEREAAIDRTADAIRDIALLGASLRSPRLGTRDIEIAGKRYVYDSASARLYELPTRQNG